VCGLTELLVYTKPDAALTLPRSITGRSRRTPTLSPASPRSQQLRNISTPVQVVVLSCPDTNDFKCLSPTLITPRSTRPVTKYHDREIEIRLPLASGTAGQQRVPGVGIIFVTAAITCGWIPHQFRAEGAFIACRSRNQESRHVVAWVVRREDSNSRIFIFHQFQQLFVRPTWSTLFM